LIRSQEELDGLGMWHVWVQENACRALVGKPDGNMSLEKPRHRWEDNIKVNIQELGLEARTGLI
jgi:hypothetical protein